MFSIHKITPLTMRTGREKLAIRTANIAFTELFGKRMVLQKVDNFGEGIGIRFRANVPIGGPSQLSGGKTLRGFSHARVTHIGAVGEEG